jgi:Domain of unknown function (DUF3387)
MNPTRIDYAAKLQEVIDRYNAGTLNIDSLFEELKELAQSLTEEEGRHVREELTEEELALFDLLTRPEPEPTPAQAAQVKKVASAAGNRTSRRRRPPPIPSPALVTQPAIDLQPEWRVQPWTTWPRRTSLGVDAGVDRIW